MIETFGELLSSEGWTTQGAASFWPPALLWTYVISEIAIGLACFSIPATLAYFLRERNGQRFNGFFKLLSAFIVACGFTHLLSALDVWHPIYWLDPVLKAVTALVTVMTAIALWIVIPKVLSMPSTAQLQDAVRQLEHEVSERKAVEAQLAMFNATLEERVAERTRELLQTNLVLREEVATRMRAERELHAEKEMAHVTLKSIGDGVITTDTSRRITYMNPVAERMTGWIEGQALGHSIEKVFHVVSSGNHERAPCPVGLALRHGHPRKMLGETTLLGRDASEYSVEVFASPMHEHDGTLLGAVLVFHDVSDAYQANQRMAYLANHDIVTGLPNRALLYDRLQNALTLARRDSNRLAILFVDLDNFKDINDSAGHDIGDLLLQEIAQRFIGAVRASDTVSRQGGDEFVILMPELGTEEGPAEVSQKLLHALSSINSIDRHEVRIGGSIGIAVYPEDGQDGEALIKHADLAMYHVKAAGRNGYQFYSRSMTEAVATRLRLENGLRHALNHSEFVVYYQPKIDLNTGRLIGAEALVRWQHPESGLIPPAQFIPAAERSGLIKPLGSWVLREVCRQNRQWQMAGLGLIPIAVNLSPTQLHQEGFLEQVVDTLSELDLPHDCLEFEVTESISIHGEEKAISWLKTLKEMGVRLSIDDFGTGYSSLSYLKRLPIDCIKIDQSFVRDIATDQDDAAIIKAIISMAHSLRLEVIAEGVETADQRDFLQQHSCDQVQGYYFSEPLPAERFRQLLALEEEFV